MFHRTIFCTELANLKGANLTDQDLTNANMSGAVICLSTMPDGQPSTDPQCVDN
ncbi:MAG: hypothetical protein CMH41_01720 [Micrococcales bacterium]|nr:hypothetical protein [Micrococcales bacterium]